MPGRAAAPPSFGSELSPRGSARGGGKEQGDSFISVAVRVKPSSSDEAIAVWPTPTEGDEPCRRVCRHRGYFLEEYEFSRVFRPEDDNSALFQGLHGPAIADSVFSGVSETLFAYGQTGSGKTHTIFGAPNEPGILYHFVNEVYERSALCLGSTVHVCCYEVLGDTLTDLIKPAALVQRGLLKQEDVVSDELFLKTQKFRYKIVQVDTKSTCMTLLQDARMNRTSGVSSCNPTSSRSHAVVHIFVQNPALDVGGAGGVNSSSIGALTLVDLAGAEKEHENPSEQGRKSARLLNTSLSSLNRLLRKLQTNSLDESERRQSVLNKCLWEYLRPGCGIGMIFCVSPLYRHRASSFTTLSMATASKLIHSRRKSQYIQVPAGSLQAAYDAEAAAAASPSAAAATPRARRAASPSPATPRGRRTPESTPRRSMTPSRPSAGPQAATHRNGAKTTPARARAASATGLRGSTPSAQFAPSSPFCLPRAGLEDGLVQERTQATDMESMHQFEVKKLRRKLSKSRMQCRERLSGVEQERDQRNAENAKLRQECESLRSLFIKQQQQQMAFWAGPFMEMIHPKTNTQAPAEEDIAARGVAPVAAVLAAASPSKAYRKLGGQANLAMSGALDDAWDKSMVLPSKATLVTYSEDVPARGTAAGNPDADVKSGADPSDCVRSLLVDRDYWQGVANQLTSKTGPGGAPIVCLSLEKGTINTRSTSQLSSQSSPSFHLSDGNGEMVWSDSGTESTRSTAEG